MHIPSKRQLAICCAALLMSAAPAAVLTACGSDQAAYTDGQLDPKKCGTITGTAVNKENGNVISEAWVIAENVKTEQSYDTRTDPDGRFSLLLPKGFYTLCVSSDGYYDNNSGEYEIRKGEVFNVPELLELYPLEDDNAPAEGPASDPVPVINYHAAYDALINEIMARREYRGFDGKPLTDYATMLDYVCYDMNNDGVDELIVNTGSCEADRSICFYTFRDNTVTLVGYNFSGSHVFGYYYDNTTKQLVAQWLKDDTGGATWYQYNGTQIAVTREFGPAIVETEAGTKPQFAEDVSPADYHTGKYFNGEWKFS